MAVSVEEIHSYACTLANEAQEVVLRTAVSRAYYSAFHACRKWHAALPTPGRNAGAGGGIHQDLINQLGNPDPKLSAKLTAQSRQTAARLKDLKDVRTLADYSISSGELDTYAAAQACLLARAIISSLDT